MASRLVRPLVAVLQALLRRVFVICFAAALGPTSLAVAVEATLSSASGDAAPGSDVSPEAVRTAVARALPILAKGANGYMNERKCFACHNQTMPLLALATAARRGFDVERDDVERIATFVEKSLESGRSRYLEGRGQGGNTLTAGYALWTLALAGRKPNDTTRLVADYLAKAHQDKAGVHWRVTTHRPPSEGSHFAATAVALRGLQTYGATDPSEEFVERLHRVRQWLANEPAKDTEDRAFRLWGLALVEADAMTIRKTRDALLATQHADGGWGQLDRPFAARRSASQGAGAMAIAAREIATESDAYATATALVALAEAGLGPSDPAYVRGAAYLLRTQQADGTWRVKSRSKPIQTYFETGFPHGPDQFISSAATGWAATALAKMLPVVVDPN